MADLTDWSASTDADFITLSETSGTGDGAFTISYSENTTSAPREGVVTLRATGGTTEASRDIRLTQLSRVVVLNSREAITAELRDATRIEGDLVICSGRYCPRGTEEATFDITDADLQALQLDTITGNLIIRGTDIASLTAFGALRSIGGYLSIGGNDRLRSLPSFSSLRSIGGYLNIGGNDRLSSLSSFSLLRSIGSGLGAEEAPIRINSNPMSCRTCCAVFPFLQESLPSGYTLGGSRTAEVASNSAGLCFGR